MTKEGFIAVLNRLGYKFSVDGDHITVEGNICLANMGISSLPDNLTVTGSVNMERVGATWLPHNLTVGGTLVVESNALSHTPDNLTVGGNLLVVVPDLDKAEISGKISVTI